MSARLTRDIFIERSVKIHNDKYDYSKVIYKDCNTKVIIGCKLHGLFEQNPYSHMVGFGCLKCDTDTSVRKNTKKLEQFKSDAMKIHGYRYDYKEVDYKNAYTKVMIDCKIHGLFEQVPSSHLNGRGCFLCCKNHAFSENDFILKCKDVHGEKYDYSNVKYINSRTNVIISCKVHGKFCQLPLVHSSGGGCPRCGVMPMGFGALTTEEFISRAKKVHGDRYDYSNVKYINNYYKVDIICNAKDQHRFKQTARQHLRGTGCPVCNESHGERDIRLYLEKFKIIYKSQGKIHEKKKVVGIFDFAAKVNSKIYFIEYHGDQHYYPVGFGCELPTPLKGRGFRFNQ